MKQKLVRCSEFLVLCRRQNATYPGEFLLQCLNLLVQWKCLSWKPLKTVKQRIYHDASKVFANVLCLSEQPAFRSLCPNRRLLKVLRHCAEEKVFLCKGQQRAIDKVLTLCF